MTPASLFVILPIFLPLFIGKSTALTLGKMKMRKAIIASAILSALAVPLLFAVWFGIMMFEIHHPNVFGVNETVCDWCEVTAYFVVLCIIDAVGMNVLKQLGLRLCVVLGVVNLITALIAIRVFASIGS